MFLPTRSVLAYTNMVLLDANGFLATANLSILISLEVTFFLLASACFASGSLCVTTKQ